MLLRVRPSVVSGTVQASPSKSYSHRAMVFGLLADGRSNLKGPLLSGDTLATLRAIKMFGARVEQKGANLAVEGGRLHCPEDVINADNSGTTIRLMAGIASLLPCTTVLTGDESVRHRPMQPLMDALTELGVECRSTEQAGFAPFAVKGPNRGTQTHIKGDVSSQFISSLLISSALKEVDTEILLTTPLKSKPYVDMTMIMMRRFGAQVDADKSGFRVPGKQRYAPQTYVIPGDFSSAAFPLVAGALTGGVAVTGLDPDDKQGDRRILSILEEFGAEVKVGTTSIRATAADLSGITVDLADAPDLFPIVAVLGTQAQGLTRIINAQHVRLKESDRIRSTTEFLKRMGANIDESPDGCVVRGPTQLRGADIDSLADHRIVMAAAVAALAAEGETIISDGDSFQISYPSFVKDMQALGADMELIE
jgi:3-phosphoshikimate 1-carboxyvinyltransferase